MEALITLVLWICSGTLCAYVANRRGRDPFAWFLIGLLLGLVGLLLLFLFPVIEHPEDKVPSEQEAIAEWTPVPPTLPTSKDWFYLDSQHKQQGPLSFTSLKTIWQKGNLSPSSLVWSEGMEQWLPIEKLPNLQQNLN